MVRHIRRLVFISVLLLFAKASIGQQQTNADSLRIYLQSIRSKADSAKIERVFHWINRSGEQVLVRDDIWSSIGQLANTVSDKDYNNLASAYFSKLLSLNTVAGHERAIQIGSNHFIEQILKPATEYQYHTVLWMFRELRAAYRNLGKLNESLEYYGKAERTFLAGNDSNGVSIANNVLSGSYFRLGMPEKAVYHQGKSVAYLNDKDLDPEVYFINTLLGTSGKMNRYAVLAAYYTSDGKLNEADSSLTKAMLYFRQLEKPLLQQDVPYLFMQRAILKGLRGDAESQQAFDTCYQYLLRYNLDEGPVAVYFQARAVDLIRLDSLVQAEAYLKLAHQKIDSARLALINPWGELIPEYHEARIALKRGQPDKAIRLLQLQIQKLGPAKLRAILINVHKLLAEAYVANGNMPEAYKAISMAFNLKNAVVQDEKDARTLSFETERKIQENETAIRVLNAKDEGNKTVRLYLFGIIALLGLLALALAFFYRNKQKTGEVLAAKNLKLEQTLGELKATQTQLIQSEKMASLGELTAGIAHEIQNPLNFVNNFSEVSGELIEDMKTELNRGDIGEARLIADDVKKNLEKINYHGKRADAIVKGMLQHSRATTGQKEPTDINALCEEYLRLAYHGLRAKDNSFNATLHTTFDPSIGTVNIVRQDIGRVLLNLINNAFYAVNEKAKTSADTYEPAVTIHTMKAGNTVEVSVSDNGNGIPENIREKIFQPFFTTKPTGQGTGLGLSLSYDIVKAHGGKITIDAGNENGTVFRICLPI